MAFSDADKSFMERALTLARRAKGGTFPNPAVGAVIVDGRGEVVGEGATGACGGPHAEVRALKKAGAAAFGSTMYVTLEPCSHVGRTPPCVDAILESGVARVVAAVRDPNPLVAGAGFRRLRARGVEVQTGLLAREAALVNEDFFFAITKKRPWVALKLAMTLDGRIADARGGSKWITAPAARAAVQEIRRCHGAIAVGGNTLQSDDSKLTARCGRKVYYPARVVFSSSPYIPYKSYFLTHADEARSIIVVRDKSNKGIDVDRRRGVEYWHTGTGDDALSINTFLDMAYAEGINSILVEGGQRIASVFLENGFVNKLYLFYGNKIFGDGKEGVRFSKGLSINDSLVLRDVSHQSFGSDFLVTGYCR